MSNIASAASLYEKQAKIYPHDVKGPFATLRRVAVYVLLGLFYGVVWLTWDSRQAVLFDLPARQFHIFGLTLWPQDFIYLALLLLILALILFFVTALAGRLWCGYACPQTVWTEAFLLLERWTEGPRNKRMKLDRGPMTREKFMRKSAKQFLWITFSLWTGLTFVGYFTPIRGLLADTLTWSMHPWAVFWLFFYGFATYGNAGYLREQVCKYMCPYARFQSAMFDKNTLIIAYDENRGEARGGRKKNAERAEGVGDCIDCTLCVQVCPTGIDIREGLQYECIACAACIDVCNDVMTKMDYPTNLIRYTTENADNGSPAKILRPRILLYTALLLTITTGMLVSLTTRTPLRMEVIRDRNALYRLVADEKVENVYTLRVINMTDEAQTYSLSLQGADGFDADVPALTVAAAQTQAFPIRLRTHQANGVGRIPVTVILTAERDDNVQVERTTNFFFPMPSNE
ncbi:MAG: cytochrome c oxidase accessory protein CcoG [Gammaproteobacteria bacterium]